MNTAVTDDERIARATLTYIAEPGDPLTGALARARGAVRALEAIRSGTLTGIPYLIETPDRRRALERLRRRLGQAPPSDVIGHWLEAELRLVCPGDAEWPGGLDGLGDAAPVALWVSGQADLRSACPRSVAVTGSRAATAYGSYLAAEVSASLGAREWSVISGGSFGVDAAAHRGALGADAITIAVTAGGPDRPYPAAHAGLFDAIAAQGAVLSEAPPGVPANRLRFQARSRIIAALATGTVIVEAGSRSGAITVARHARDLGGPVMAFPGPVTSDLSAGCHQLIRDGQAVLVTCPGDVADALEAVAPSACG
jgi:DNA processing protein